MYVLGDYVIEALQRGALVDYEIQDIETVGNVIAKIRKKINLSVKFAAAAVSGQTVITKIIYMDATLSEEELANQIEIEANNLISYPLDEVSLDFESLDVNKSDPTKIDVLLSAARTESIEARVAALEYVGFEAKVLQAQQQFEQLTPLYSEYIQINYAKATDFANLIKNDDTSILSARGSVSVDERTNTLLLRDTVKSIENIKRMISILDIVVRQVIIEARMVTVKDNVGEELGIRWGVTSTDNEYSSSGSLAGAASAKAGVAPAITDRLNVNLHVVNPAASLAFQVVLLADGKILDLELSALEKENKGEIIASPQITTANQREEGVEIPYQQAS